MAGQRRQNRILSPDFFKSDALELAPKLIGKYLVREYEGNIFRSIINEVEAYLGEEDLACHASKGRTPRTEVMYREGGHIYIYLIYGMYYMLNIVTGEKDHPQAILIRGTQEVSGPGRLTKFYHIDKSLNTKLLLPETGLWLEESNIELKYKTTPRIGVAYAKEWALKPWRYVAY
jgi:DNA-3-methyladenine glycosylase